MTSARNRDNIN